MLRLGYRIFEVPISYMGRTYEEGKKIKKRDGLLAIWTLLKYRNWKGTAPRMKPINPVTAEIALVAMREASAGH